MLTISVGLAAGQTSVTTCELQENAANYLNAVVEVRSMIIVGSGHAAFIRGENCKFLFAFGDDYQTFGSQFPARKDVQWKKMRQTLSHTECANNIRAVRGRLQGTVIHVPATGTIPPDEMGLELVIQSISDVEPVPIKCKAVPVSH
jgi:hypothetical protein